MIAVGDARIDAHGFSVHRIEDADLKRIPPRRVNGHKGSYGKVLVVAGSREICGAALLSGLAALRSGIGMVRICTHELNRTPLASAFPEALLSVYSDDGPDDARLDADLSWADLVLIGPGLGTDACAASLLRRILARSSLPCVMDADALNLMAVNPDWWDLLCAPAVITPHVAEMSRLCGRSVQEIRDDLATTAKRFAREHHIVCVLKDITTAIADPDGDVYICAAGNSALATAGSGDVLAGITAGLIAQCGMTAEDGSVPMAALAALVHGLCGRAASEKRSKRTVIAGDLIDEMHAFL